MLFANLWKAIILGIIEGITEWLPISSTGHLILVDEFIKLDLSKDFMEMFNVVIQLGAIMAVVILYFHKLNPFSPKKNGEEKTQKEVADMMGISQSYISRLEKKIIKRLKKEMTKMGC